MKKTIPISIAQTIFYIEEDSYEKLDNYLSEVKKYFSSYKDNADIIQDIESRIREQFLQFSEEDKTERIITLIHIDKLIKNMGWPKEFGEFSTEENKSSSENANQVNEENAPKEKSRKRLYRNKENAIIGGVASGIATYFGINPVIVRIMFFLSIFFGGMGILLYLVLWFVVPEARTATEILEMQGDPMNLNEVKKIIEEKINEVGDKKKIKSGVNNFFEEVRNISIKLASIILKIISRIIGILLKIVSVVGVIFFLMFLGFALITGKSENMFTQFHTLPYFYIFSLIIFIAGLIPFMFLDKLSNVFFNKKIFQKTKYASIAFALWATAIVLGLVLFFSVHDQYIDKIRSSTQVIKVFETVEEMPKDSESQ